VLDARLHLLDRQVLDRDGVPVTTVDDLELETVVVGEDLPEHGRPPRLTALLDGNVLLTRILGGRPPSSRLQRIGLDRVAEIGVVVRLTTRAEEEPTGWPERWLRDRLIRHIPGGRRDPG